MLDIQPATGPGNVTIGLIGRGIGASLSPIMHEQEGQRQGLNYRYHLIDFDRLGLDDDCLESVIEDAAALGFAGLNITYPFKQAVLPLLTQLSPNAAAIGAVNTVVLRDGERIGHNTDSWGFGESFRQTLADVPRDCALLIGAGGAGAAVAHALLQGGVRQLMIHDASPERAAALIAALRERYHGEIESVDDLPAAAAEASGIVNATPVGMHKHPGLPLDAALLAPRHWVADVVYFPLETALIAHARGLGCRVLPGGGMAVYQAVRAFALFTGLAPDAAAMSATFEAALVA